MDINTKVNKKTIYQQAKFLQKSLNNKTNKILKTIIIKIKKLNIKKINS